MFFHVNTRLGVDFNLDFIGQVPQFEVLLQDKELGLLSFKWIVLVYDYMSPIRHMNEADRMAQATEMIYGKKFMPELNSDKVKAAIDKYVELSYDSDFAEYYSIESACTQISQLIDETEKNMDNMESLQKAGATLKTLNALKTDLKDILFTKIQSKDDDMKIRSGKKLSYADKKFGKNK